MDDSFTLRLDAHDGCYILDGSTLEDEEGLILPEGAETQPGTIAQLPAGWMVNTLGGLDSDERVKLTVSYRKGALSESEVRRKSSMFESVSSFSLESKAGIVAVTLNMGEQGTILTTQGEYYCHLFMRIQNPPVDQDDPHETHFMSISPSRPDDNEVPWWARDSL